jgi:hypothetical protein
MTNEQLAAELTNDPQGLGYAGKTIREQADLLNAPRESVTFPRIVDVGTILGVFALAPFRVVALDETDRLAWTEVFHSIRALKEGFRPSDAPVQQLLQQGVVDGVILEAEKQMLEAIGVRQGSRAEQLWGEGAIVSINDIALVR